MRFSKTRELKSLKAAFTTAFFAAVTHNYDHKQRTLKHRNAPPIRNHQPWPFEAVELNICFLRGPRKWLTTAKKVNASWLLNFGICVFLKSAVNSHLVPVRSQIMNDSHELTFGDLYPTEFLCKTNHFFANLPDTFRELSCSNLLIVLNIEKAVTIQNWPKNLNRIILFKFTHCLEYGES